MTGQDSSRQFAPREEGKANVATGNVRHAPTHDIGDSAKESVVPGSLAPRPLPIGFDGEATSESRAEEDDSRKADDVAELKKMERNAEDGRE